MILNIFWMSNLVCVLHNNFPENNSHSEQQCTHYVGCKANVIQINKQRTCFLRDDILVYEGRSLGIWGHTRASRIQYRSMCQ